MIEWFKNLTDGNKIAIAVPVGLAVIAGLVVLLKWLFGIITRRIREKTIYLWLKKSTNDKAGEQFKTTNELSQALRIDEDQIRKACTASKRVYHLLGKKDFWGIYGDKATSVYDERGPIVI